jgi:shikimate 5-dehydrogenase
VLRYVALSSIVVTFADHVKLAYKPRITPLLKQIRTLSHKGWIGVDGLEVLPEQGFAQFELFLGREAPRGVMRDAVETAYDETKQ